MATWERIQRGFFISRDGLTGDRQFARVLYLTKNLSHTGGGTTTDARDILDNPDDTPPLPKYGDSYGDDLPLARCVSKRIVEGPKLSSAVVEVIFSSDWSFGDGYPRTYGYGFTDVVTLLQPVYTMDAASEAFAPVYQFRYRPVDRIRIWRTRQKVVGLGDIEAYLPIIELNIGKAYLLDYGELGTVPFVFHGYKLIETPTIGQFVLTYYWWTTSPIESVGAGDEPSVDVTIPALGRLDEYIVGAVSGGEPYIAVRDWTKRYSPGGPLP